MSDPWLDGGSGLVSQSDAEDGLWVVGGWTVACQRGCDCLSL